VNLQFNHEGFRAMLRFMRVAWILAALSPIAAGSAAANDDTSYPLVIDHALGTTVIARKPVRVATVAWANHEVPLALGIVPVGFAAANFGDDDGDGLLPWVAERLAELGAATPVLFDETDGIDFEAVAATEPDVILAAYSGLSQADYDTLSLIAPVVAFPHSAWSTDWRETIRLNSAAMGMAGEGEALVSRIQQQIADTASKHPGLKGKSALFVTHVDLTNLSMVNFYTANDTRVKFFEDLGLDLPAVVRDAGAQGRFSGSISAERIDMFDDVDVVVTYGSPGMLAMLALNPLLSRMPAVENGAIVLLDRNPLGTAANPTPLSIPWVLEDYADLLAAAAAKAD
jgi:iron complex transport system substrate-binding protein